MLLITMEKTVKGSDFRFDAIVFTYYYYYYVTNFDFIFDLTRFNPSSFFVNRNE